MPEWYHGIDAALIQAPGDATVRDRAKNLPGKKPGRGVLRRLY
jgi:hypothetical protein